MKAIASRLGFSQAASGLVSGVFTPFFAAWLAWRGLSPSQIGAVLSAGLLLRALLGPASGIMADARNDRRTVMIVLYWAMLAGYGALNFAKAPLAVFVAAVSATVAFGSATPLLESVSVRLSERYGFNYGRVRLWASSAFVAANILGGLLVTWLGIRIVAPWLALRGGLVRSDDLASPCSSTRSPAWRSCFAIARHIRRNARIAALRRVPDFPGGRQFRPGKPCLLLRLWRAALVRLGLFRRVDRNPLAAGRVRRDRACFPNRCACCALWDRHGFCCSARLAASSRWTILAFDPPMWLGRARPVSARRDLRAGASGRDVFHPTGGAFALGRHGAESLFRLFGRVADGDRDLCVRQSLCVVWRTRLSADGRNGHCRDRLCLAAWRGRWHGERILASGHEEHPDTV